MLVKRAIRADAVAEGDVEVEEQVFGVDASRLSRSGPVLSDCSDMSELWHWLTCRPVENRTCPSSRKFSGTSDLRDIAGDSFTCHSGDVGLRSGERRDEPRIGT